MVISLVLAVLIGVPAAGMAFLYVGFEGGLQSVAWNHSSAPDQDKPEVVAQRVQARSKAEAALSDLNRSKVLSQGPASYSAFCRRGQNNFKVHEGYSHECYVVAAHFYSWTGGFPAMARALDEELRQDGWQLDKYEGGLPHLADQFEAGRNPYQNPTPGVPVVLDFSRSWSTCYEKGEAHVCFKFADRNTNMARQADSLDFDQNRTQGSFWSYSENRETVDSRATVDDLLDNADGVVFASTEEYYYSIRR